MRMAHSDPEPVYGYWASQDQPDFMIQVSLICVSCVGCGNELTSLLTLAFTVHPIRGLPRGQGQSMRSWVQGVWCAGACPAYFTPTLSEVVV